MPKTAKGQKFKFETTCAAWVDLLGYGAMLENVSFDPTTEAAAEAIARVEKFHLAVTHASRKLFPTFVMNDGAVVYRDLSPRSREPTFDFLKRAIELHQRINDVDRIEGNYPGARMVIATGFRVRRIIDHSARLTLGEAKAIKEKLAVNKISVGQAINQALMVRHEADSTPELQHNFAFTKAYLADHGGRAAGLGGPNCYIDFSLFDDDLPSWISFDQRVAWSNRGLKAVFGRFQKLDPKLAKLNGFVGVRDAFDIANHIAVTPNAAKRIRESRMPDLRTKSPKENS